NYLIWYAPAVGAPVREEKEAQYYKRARSSMAPARSARSIRLSSSFPIPNRVSEKVRDDFAAHIVATGGKRPGNSSLTLLWSSPTLLRRQGKLVPDRDRQRRVVQRVEVQAWRAALDQRCAHLRHHIEAECADRRRIVAEAFEAAPDPAWNLGAARVRKARELREASDRHDAGHDRHVQAAARARIDEMPVRVGVEEVLRDRRVGAGVDLALETREIVVGIARLRVIFGVCRDVDVEPVAGFIADEADELVRIAEIADVDGAGRHVAAQRDEMADAVLAIL